MRRSKLVRAFALYEVLIGLTIFVVGTLTIGRAVQNCISATTLSEEEERVRLVLSNRMAEIQATPGVPDAKRESKVDTGYGQVVVRQTTTPAGLKDDKGLELNGISHVTLSAEWNRSGVDQKRKLEFYVYRAG